MSHENMLPEKKFDIQDLSYDQAVTLKRELTWKKLKSIPVIEAVGAWLQGIKSNATRKNYASGMQQLANRSFIDLKITLQEFSMINHENLLDQIKLEEDWSEATKQARAALYISFTGFLSRRTSGIISKVVPSREGYNKTFFRVRNYVKTNAMTRFQWDRFLTELDKINHRDYLIAKLMLQGGKRKSEVLSARIESIDFTERTITYHQTKTKGTDKITVITYPKEIMDQLIQLLDGRTSGLIFITRNGKQVQPNQIDRSFLKAGDLAHVPFRVTPHVLRASTVTYLKEQGFPDSDIMKVTGHSSSEMIFMYDKSAREDNASKKISLV